MAELDPILVSLAALGVTVWAADRWWTTRRVAASACRGCGQPLGLTAARRRRKLQLVGKDIWEVACVRCGPGQLVWFGRLGR